MDATSVYLRLFLGARAFSSCELDSLASRMGVLDRLSANPGDRYFITPFKGATAASLGRKVVFGRRYYELMTDEQRVAVGAHEFAHMLNGDDRRLKVAMAGLFSSCALVAALYLGFHSVLLAELGFLGSFFVSMRLLSSRESRQDIGEELQCDSVAASFVSPSILLSSIQLAESIIKPRNVPGGKTKGSPNAAVEERAFALSGLRSQNT